MGYFILINREAGTVLKIGRETLRAKIFEILGDKVEALEFVAPQDMMARLAELQDEHCVLIGGGDGTITAIASHLIKKERPFGIIPLGTMNLFAQDIGVPNDWEAALKAYEKSAERYVDVGFANGELFLCNAMFGITTEVAKEREKARKSFGPGAWLRVARKFWEKLTEDKNRRVDIDSKRRKGRAEYKAIVVSNNKYRDDPGLACNLKQSLEDGMLSIYIVNPQNAIESAALIARLAAGGWHKEPYVENFDADKIIFKRRKKNMAVLLDGELKTLKTPVRFEIKPGALAVLAPQGCEEMARAAT